MIKVTVEHSECSVLGNDFHCTLPFCPEKPEPKHGKKPNTYSSWTMSGTCPQLIGH